MSNIGLKRGYNLITRKPIKLPEILIYEAKIPNEQLYQYNMFSLKNTKHICKMICYKQGDFTDGDNLSTLCIQRIRALPQKQGMGSRMINFAKNLSESWGCEGRIKLLATWILDSEGKCPHTFYRKHGFNTGIKEFDEKLDLFINEGKIGTKNDFDYIKMYYPSIDEIKEPEIKKKSLSEIIKERFFKNKKRRN